MRISKIEIGEFVGLYDGMKVCKLKIISEKWFLSKEIVANPVSVAFESGIFRFFVYCDDQGKQLSDEDCIQCWNFTKMNQDSIYVDETKKGNQITI